MKSNPTGGQQKKGLRRGWSPMDKLMDSFVCLPNGCWEWKEYKNKKGYGRVRLTGFSYDQ